jgi:hypothetical protein
MKKVLLTVVCLAMVLFWANGLQAYSIDGIFQFYKAGVAPTIDGIMDDVWKCASTERMIKVCVDDAAGPDNYNDMFATARAMWDEENIYLFLQATDDLISTSLANRYENDSFEFYFDGDLSQATSYDNWDDIQIRVMWTDTEITDFTARTDNVYDPTGSVIGLCEWEYPELTDGDAPKGWNCEVKLPLGPLDIEGEAGSLFGFETQLNENDENGARENMLRWWGYSNNGWNNPSVFGVATLSDYIASPTLKIVKAKTAPTIDGDLDAAWIAPQIDMTTFVVREGETVPSGFAELDDSTDCYMSFRAMWDDDNLYFFVNVIDETLFGDLTSSEVWNQDGVEICIDGENEKNVGSQDANDIQMRWVYGATTPESAAGRAYGGTWAFKETDDGYNFELALPADSLLFVIEEDHEIGLEIQVNDNDGQSTNPRENMARWWGDDNLSWSHPELWGTAALVTSMTNAIDNEPVAKARRFELSQNYPNPFNASTSISYTIEKAGMVKLTVFDMVGKEVANLVNEVRNPGDYKVTFDGSNLSTGIYFYRLETRDHVATQKMMLLK